MKKQFRRLIFRNTRYKVSALIIAVAIWFSLTQRSFKDVSVGPVSPTFSHPGNFIVEMETPQQIYLKLECPAYLLEDYNITPEQFSVDIVVGPQTVNERELIEAEDHEVVRSIELDSGFVRNRMPERIRNKIFINSLAPNHLALRVRLLTKWAPLSPKIQGEPLEGFIYREPEILSQPQIEITGLPEALARVDAIPLPPIDLAGLSRDVTRQVEIGVQQLREEFNVWPLWEEDERVTLRIQIEPARQVKTLSSIPVQVRNPPSESTVQILPDSVEVEVQGPPSILERIDPGEVTAEVDLTGFNVGQYPGVVYELRNLPDQVEVLRRSTESITIKIEGRPIGRFDEDLTR
jgi:hypothetical protein